MNLHQMLLSADFTERQIVFFGRGGDWAYRLRRSRPSSDYYWCLARSSKRMDGWMDNASDCVLGRILLALNKFYN